ncbi:MAG: DHHW family protein [Oscillospiraceae bacterium]|nr:DHHW family protein [Oscillospiraceae bacterium]
MKPKITVFIFAVMLLGIAAINLASPVRGFSENENRYLAQLPAFSWDTLFAGRYTPALDDFVIDQFAFRDSWVGVKTMAERLLLKGSSGGAYFASDGSVIEMFTHIDRDRFSRNLTHIRDFALRALEETGAETTVMLVPTQSMVRRHVLPLFAPENGNALLGEAAAALEGAANFIDISPSLNQHRDEYIFYKTDHHWTSLGAYYAYNSMRGQQGQPIRGIEQFRLQVLSTRFYGTTWSKASLYSAPPDVITAYITRETEGLGALRVEYSDNGHISGSLYEPSFLAAKDKYSVFLNGNHPIVRIGTGLENGRRLMVIKDSFANSFAQFLAADYEEVILLDPRYYRGQYIDFARENDITDILVLYGLKGFTEDANLYFITT